MGNRALLPHCYRTARNDSFLTSLGISQDPGGVSGVDWQRGGVGAVYVPGGRARRNGGGIEVEYILVNLLV